MKKTNTNKTVVDTNKTVVDINKIMAFVSLIIALASLIVAIYALNTITKVQGFENLLKKTSENTNELKQQNSLQQNSIDNNSIGINELKHQTKTLLELQESNANQLDIQKNEDRSILIGDFLILKNLYWKLNSMKSIPDYRDFFVESNRKGTLQYLNDLKSIINEGINTKLLKMNDKIYSQWWFFENQIESTINTLNGTNMLIASEKYYNIQVPFEYSRNGKEISKNENDLETLISFEKYLKIFWKKGATPLLEIKEMRYYYDSYQKLSNMGRDF